MGQDAMILRRSELAVPAGNDHMFDKAATCGADLVFLDLEDAVPAAFKAAARAKAIAALNDIDAPLTAINGSSSAAALRTASYAAGSARTNA